MKLSESNLLRDAVKDVTLARVLGNGATGTPARPASSSSSSGPCCSTAPATGSLSAERSSWRSPKRTAPF